MGNTAPIHRIQPSGVPVSCAAASIPVTDGLAQGKHPALSLGRSLA